MVSKKSFDSGSKFESITDEKISANFNCSNDDKTVDDRSGKKGPEPESVTVGTVGGKTYAFIALERIGGVMVYDITNPDKTEFVNYINSRNLNDDIRGDVSPEGLCFIPAAQSKTGKPLLLAACEVSGTLAVYELTGEQEKLRIFQRRSFRRHLASIRSSLPSLPQRISRDLRMSRPMRIATTR